MLNIGAAQLTGLGMFMIDHPAPCALHRQNLRQHGRADVIQRTPPAKTDDRFSFAGRQLQRFALLAIGRGLNRNLFLIVFFFLGNLS